MSESPAPPARTRLFGRFLGVALALVVVVVVGAVSLVKLVPEPAASTGPGSPSAASGSQVPGALEIGAPAPALAGQTLDGTTLDLTQLRGKAVVVNFWASWCPPCKREFPAFKSVLARHAPDGLAVVGVLFNDGAAPARAFVAQEAANWPTVLDPSGSAAKAYGVFGAPETFLIDRSGVVRARLLGDLTEPSLEQAVAGILR